MSKYINEIVHNGEKHHKEVGRNCIAKMMDEERFVARGDNQTESVCDYKN